MDEWGAGKATFEDKSDLDGGCQRRLWHPIDSRKLAGGRMTEMTNWTDHVTLDGSTKQRRGYVR